MPSNYSLPDVLARIYENQQVLQTAELPLLVDEQWGEEVGGNVLDALRSLGENADHIKQGMA
ncbi:hypothetical protein [Pseudomonas monsensis]|uniref:hypothetical protein n=1 Tax=Pseudomonas monsensis TaxID=2745509 RepID=UPI00300E77ED